MTLEIRIGEKTAFLGPLRIPLDTDSSILPVVDYAMVFERRLGGCKSKVTEGRTCIADIAEIVVVARFLYH